MPDSVHDSGSTPLAPHSFLRSCKYSWNVVWLGIPVRTYVGVERRVGRDDSKTHAIQILHKPRHIPALQTWNDVLIRVSAKKVAEVLVELGRSSVEVVERLQGI